MKKRNTSKKALSLVLIMLLILSFTGCAFTQPETPGESSAEISEEPTPQPSAEPTPEPTPEATPEPTPEPTPEATPEVSEEASEEISVDFFDEEIDDFLPPATDNDEFNAAFRKNEIDLEYFEAAYDSGSTKAMTRAASVAAEKWQDVIDSSYDVLISISDDPSAVESDRNNWDSTKAGALEDIITRNEGDSISAAYETVIFCRAKAAEILEQIFAISGEFDLSPDAVG